MAVRSLLNILVIILPIFCNGAVEIKLKASITIEIPEGITEHYIIRGTSETKGIVLLSVITSNNTTKLFIKDVMNKPQDITNVIRFNAYYNETHLIKGQVESNRISFRFERKAVRSVDASHTIFVVPLLTSDDTYKVMTKNNIGLHFLIKWRPKMPEAQVERKFYECSGGVPSVVGKIDKEYINLNSSRLFDFDRTRNIVLKRYYTKTLHVNLMSKDIIADNNMTNGIIYRPNTASYIVYRTPDVNAKNYDERQQLCIFEVMMHANKSSFALTTYPSKSTVNVSGRENHTFYFRNLATGQSEKFGVLLNNGKIFYEMLPITLPTFLDDSEDEDMSPLNLPTFLDDSEDEDMSPLNLPTVLEDSSEDDISPLFQKSVQVSGL